ncbi:hypothetical protein SAMN04487996_107124 [Dyadobacter soli]|uniref:Uncharacterized protein n=1 Tax=Dyadobacter soli TaxID=659014 RepID=A0A1G7G4V3_9BACT|nr:hypothetical protein [Dyadobacter soli]SDE83162.1 hypothetical protein SAMN04487996_107124 [Dyadobacter soli]
MNEFIELAIQVVRKYWPELEELPSDNSKIATLPVYEAILSYESPTIIVIFHSFENKVKVVCQAFENTSELRQYAATKYKTPTFRELPAHESRDFTYEGDPASIRKVTPVPKSAVAAGPQVEGLPSEEVLLHIIKECFEQLGVKF